MSSTDALLIKYRSFNLPVQISRESRVRNRVEESVDFLTRHLAAGKIVYGMFHLQSDQNPLLTL